MPPEPRFLCDNMLGSLARWLRFLGYDTLYPEAMGDTELLHLAECGGRLLLTRDKELAGRAREGGRLVQSDVLDEQIAQVKAELGLDFSDQRLLSRCSLCNTVLHAISIEEAEKAGVPAPLLRRHDRFWRCPGCCQLYWPGSHYERIMGKIGELDKGA
jgi:hypothetical protein